MRTTSCAERCAVRAISRKRQIGIRIIGAKDSRSGGPAVHCAWRLASSANTTARVARSAGAGRPTAATPRAPRPHHGQHPPALASAPRPSSTRSTRSTLLGPRGLLDHLGHLWSARLGSTSTATARPPSLPRQLMHHTSAARHGHHFGHLGPLGPFDHLGQLGLLGQHDTARPPRPPRPPRPRDRLGRLGHGTA